MTARIAFAGTPEFAAVTLAALLDAGYTVPLVLTQPDRPAGRGMQSMPSPVKQLALERGIRVDQPVNLRTDAARQALREAVPDLLVVAAYGLLLPREVLELPRLGCVNIHASLLPRWRGAAPIQRAILAGDAHTGITLMQMDAGLDTGAMLAVRRLDIGDDDTTQSLHDTLAQAGAALLVEHLPALLAGSVPATPQPTEGVTYADKISKHEAELDLRRPARELALAVRAYSPFPGASIDIAGLRIKLWRARAEAACGRPGQILAADRDGVLIACGSGALRASVLQKPGGKRLPAADFLRGHPLAAGDFARVPD